MGLCNHTVKVSHVSNGHDGCPFPFVHGSQGQDALATTIQGPGHFRHSNLLSEVRVGLSVGGVCTLLAGCGGGLFTSPGGA